MMTIVPETGGDAAARCRRPPIQPPIRPPIYRPI
jgi:hypothetical protein